MNRNMTARNYLITVLLAITSNYLAAPLAAAYDGSDIHYDPEQQDGIPVISSRSLAPAITGRYGDRLAEMDSTAAPSSERRNSDADLDDGLEDEDEAEDRDEYKSGSSNHDTYESPAFGESRRAAKDGDDIESFFDKHLGPQDAIENRDDNEIPINETPLRASAVDSDSDSDGDGDGYEAAASGPIATILSSIINRRPIVITATTGGSDQSSDSKASASDEKQTQLSLGESSTAGAAAAGDEGEVGGVPVAFYAPMAASSNAYEQEQSEQAPLRETIYVSRQPYATAAGGQQQRYQPLLYPAHLMDQQASNAAASMRFRGRQPQYYQARYPAAAHSHSYQRQRPQPAEDDEQTVSYNLSFGGGGASSALLADDETTAGAGDEAPDEQVAAAEPADYERRPLAGYSSMRSYASPMMMVVNPADQQRLYLQQQQQRAMLLQQQQNQQQQQTAQMQMQQQAARAGARYHKDPSESIASQYVQYSRQAPATPQQQRQQQRRQPQSAAPADTQQQRQPAVARDELRDQLLASLSEQIKANPNYWRPAADGGSSETRDGSGSGGGGGSPAPSSSTDVDTYSSYHSEVGPHSSRTTSSRLVSGPAAAPAARADSPLESAYLVGGNHLRKFPQPQQQQPSEGGTQANSRVRRDDSEEREGADDDDGVWVDDDDDDDNRQQSSSDVNETAQDPSDEDEDSDGSQQDGQLEDSNQHRAAVSPPPVGQLAGGVARLHGYEISPDDLMVYPPSVM